MVKNRLFIAAAILLLLSMFFPRGSANANPELVVIYSDSSPTIDGYLRAEWNDTTSYKVNLTGPEDIETWIYLKHNGTYIYIGLLVWLYQIHSVDQFTILFDEGDDGSRGSGTRDNVLTDEQEDLKSCQPGPILKDGFYNDTAWRAFNVEIDFEANCVHENDHGTTQDEIEYWEGLLWVDDHWECEFAIPFMGNDGGTEDGSDLVCTMSDMIGMKIQYFTQPGANNYFYPAENIYQINTYADLSFSHLPIIESCNLTGAKKDSFNLEETVYVNGSGYAPSQTYDFYVVNDVATWTNGLPIPARVADTVTTVSSDALGNIPPTVVWANPQTIGEYDTVVDMNGNGLYDENVDVLDDNDVMVTAGFIIPEFSALMSLLMLVLLLGVITYRKR